MSHIYGKNPSGFLKKNFGGNVYVASSKLVIGRLFVTVYPIYENFLLCFGLLYQWCAIQRKNHSRKYSFEIIIIVRLQSSDVCLMDEAKRKDQIRGKCSRHSAWFTVTRAVGYTSRVELDAWLV